MFLNLLTVAKRLRLIAVFVFSLGANLFGFHSLQSTPFTTVSAIRRQVLNKSNDQLVHLRGVVTALSGWNNSFFLQDATGGISIDRREDAAIEPGDEVELTGTVNPGRFAPLVISTRIRMLGHVSLPKPKPTTYLEAASGALDSQWIELTGVVESAQIERVWNKRILVAQLRMGESTIQLNILNFEGVDFSYLVDSLIKVDGVCGTIFNGHRQVVGIRMFVPGLKELHIESASIDLAHLRLTPISRLLAFSPDAPRDRRVRTSGFVTFQRPGELLYLQNEGQGICVKTRETTIFPVGTRVEAFGFLASEGYSSTLDDATIQAISPGLAPAPITVRANEVIVNKDGFPDAPFDGRLIRVRGYLVERLPQTASQLWLLKADGREFQAELSRSSRDTQIEPGSTVELSGICRIESDAHHNPTGFRLLLRDNRDIVVVRSGNSVSLSFLALALSFVVAAGVLIWLLQRRDFESPLELRSATKSRRSPVLYWLKLTRIFAFVIASGGFVLALTRIFAAHLFRESAQANSLNAAKCALFSGLGFALWQSAGERKNRTLGAVANVCAAFAALIGGATVTEYVTGLKFKIALLDIYSGSLSLATAVAVLLLGGVFLIMRFPALTTLAQGIALLIGSMSILGLNGWLYGVHDFPGVAVYAKMDLPSAATLLLLCLGILLCHSERGLMRAVSANAPGGLMARRALPVALVAPSLLGWIRWKVQLLGFYDTSFGLALFASSNALSFVSLLWSSAALLNRLDYSRARAERETLEREEQFRLLLESAPDAMLMCGKQGEIVMVNGQSEVLFGHTREALQTQNIRNLIPVSFEEQISSCWRQEGSLPSVGDAPLYFNAIRKDGSECPVEIRLSPIIQTTRGQVVVAAVRDVTARKQMEKDLFESEQRYRLVVESLPQIAFTARADGEVDFASNTWREYTGLADASDWSERIHPDDRELVAKKWRASIATGANIDFEHRIRNRAGQYRWFRCIAVPVHDAQGQVARWFGIDTDVDDYKRAEAEIRAFNETLETRVAERTTELRDSEERFRSIIDGVHDYAIVTLDPIGNLISWNEGAERQKGYRAEEVLGKQFKIFYSPEDRNRGVPREDLDSTQLEGETQREGWRVRKDGSRFWASVVITAVRYEDGSLRGFSEITRDISERKRVEDLLQRRNSQLAQINDELSLQKCRAEQATVAKSEFLAAMSHEIRTPMNAILAMADILWETPLSPEQRDLVEIFRRNGRSLLTLINDILDFSRIESGQFELENIAFDLNEVIRQTAALVQVTAQAKQLDVTVDLSPDLPRQVIGDPGRLTQIVLNLLNNAVKFTLWGKIILRAKQSEQDRAMFEFAVVDSGIGIAPEKLNHIFDKFTQADSSTARKFGGTGLGLSICRSLVERMGGRIYAESVLGQGSTFHFSVRFQPVNDRATQNDSLRVQESAQSKLTCSRSEQCESSLRLDQPDKKILQILIAEDIADNRQVYKLYMKGQPHKISFAENGQEALELFSMNAYDLILMDLQMPVLDGLSATRAIRSLEQRRNASKTPIVAVSADAGLNDRASCLAAGCNDHVAKPISLRRFLSLLDEYATSKKPPLNSPGEADVIVTEAIRSLSPAYLKDRRKDAEALSKLVTENNFAGIRSLAHQIKGTGTTFGFPDLTRLAAALEAAAETRDANSVSAQVLELTKFLETASVSSL